MGSPNEAAEPGSIDPPASDSDQYCLRWTNHGSHVLAVFRQLLCDEALVDVTLAAEGQSLRAHKMVLSACSSFFRTIFVSHPERHPIIILKDTKFAELKTLLEFMYRGEVSVEYGQLGTLLKTAENLRVKGLTEVSTNDRQHSDPGAHKGNSTNPETATSTTQPPLSPEPLPPQPQSQQQHRHSLRRCPSGQAQNYSQFPAHHGEDADDLDADASPSLFDDRLAGSEPPFGSDDVESAGNEHRHALTPLPSSSTAAAGLQSSHPHWSRERERDRLLHPHHYHPYSRHSDGPSNHHAYRDRHAQFQQQQPPHRHSPHYTTLDHRERDRERDRYRPGDRSSSHSRSNSSPLLVKRELQTRSDSGTGPEKDPEQRFSPNAAAAAGDTLASHSNPSTPLLPTPAAEEEASALIVVERFSPSEALLHPSATNNASTGPLDATEPSATPTPPNHRGVSKPPPSPRLVLRPSSNNNSSSAAAGEEGSRPRTPKQEAEDLRVSSASPPSNNSANFRSSTGEAGGRSGSAGGAAQRRFSTWPSLQSESSDTESEDFPMASPSGSRNPSRGPPYRPSSASGMGPPQHIPLALKKEQDWEGGEGLPLPSGGTRPEGPPSRSRSRSPTFSESSSEYGRHADQFSDDQMPTAEVVIEEGEFLSPTPSMSGDARTSSLRFGGNGGDRRYITFSTGNDSADNSAHGGGDLSPSPTLPGKDKSNSSHLGSHRDHFQPFMPVGVPQFDVGIRFGGLNFGMGSGGSRSESSTPRPLGDLEDGEASSDPTSSMHAAAAAAAAAAAMAGLGFSPGMSLIESHVGLGFSLGSREKPYKCEQCGQCYKYLSAFTKHKEQNHTARLPGEKPFRCEVCGMQFKYLKSFKKHRLNHAVERLHPAYHRAMGIAEEHRSVLEMLARPGGHLPLLMVPDEEDPRPSRSQAGPSHHHGSHRGGGGDPDVKLEGRLSGASSVSSENNEGRSGGEGSGAGDLLLPPSAGADSPSAANPNADHVSVSSSRSFVGPSTSAMAAARQICVCPVCRMKFVNEESLRIHSLSCMDRLARQQQQSSVTVSVGNAQHANNTDGAAASAALAASSTSSSSSASSSSAGVLSSSATCTTSPFAASLQETVRQHQAMIAAGLFSRNAMPPPSGLKPFAVDQAKTNNATSGGGKDGANAEDVPSDENMEGSDREGSENDLTEDAQASSSNSNAPGGAPAPTVTPPASSSSLVVSSNHQSPSMVTSNASSLAAATLQQQQQRHPTAHLSGAAAMSSPFMSGMFREFTAAAAAAAATAMAAGVPPPEYDPGRPHLCPFCGKGFRAKENLKLHIRKHTGERPFECEFCGRAFGGKSDMNRHLRIHTGERPYRCDACGKTFARADYLSKHLSTHLV